MALFLRPSENTKMRMYPSHERVRGAASLHRPATAGSVCSENTGVPREKCRGTFFRGCVYLGICEIFGFTGARERRRRHAERWLAPTVSWTYPMRVGRQKGLGISPATPDCRKPPSVSRTRRPPLAVRSFGLEDGAELRWSSHVNPVRVFLAKGICPADPIRACLARRCWRRLASDRWSRLWRVPVGGSAEPGEVGTLA